MYKVVHLQGPTAAAIAAIVSEKPTSYGWQDKFPRDMWAVTFNGKPSPKVRTAAANSGLHIIHDLNSGKSAIGVPGINKTEVKEAEELFIKFAEEYKRVSKKVASIIVSHINEGAVQVKKTNKKSYSIDPKKIVLSHLAKI